MKYPLAIVFTACSYFALAQPAAKLTTIKDTSYNTLSDYHHNLKNFPNIKIVPDSPVVSVKETRDLTYCNVGSRALKLDAFVPQGKKRVPAIILIHGGGWRSGNRTQHIPLAQHLAAEGFACFTVEYRLSTEALYPAAVHDLKAAVRWIRANAVKYNVDATKIAALGFSAGGELAAFMGTTSGMAKFDGNECNKNASSSVQAVVDIDGTLSFVAPDSWETQNTTNVGASAWWIGYPRTENITLWTEASPLTYVNNNKAPFLFLNSSVERMHAGRDEFKKLAEKRGVNVEVKQFGETPHSFCLYEPWFTPTVQTIKSFLSKVFKR
jgi:pectinesterase